MSDDTGIPKQFITAQGRTFSFARLSGGLMPVRIDVMVDGTNRCK